ncbi:GreA/GreB family elongation factor [Candidatus Uhrbacteria bacterium]|nr:GreA/GreB family elongation factor [Candidatus Uhrbacteria bacterium]
MRLPTRRSEKLKIQPNDGPLYLTQEGLEKLKRKLATIEQTELPKAIEDVRTTAEFGDFSENAEYQEAKWRMRRLHNQVLTLKEKIRQAVLIQTDQTPGMVQMGSTLVLLKNNAQKTYRIVGPQEADPSRGNISHLSPLGAALIGHQQGETVNGFLIVSVT